MPTSVCYITKNHYINSYRRLERKQGINMQKHIRNFHIFRRLHTTPKKTPFMVQEGRLL